MIAQSWVEEDAGLLLGLLGHVDGHVQVLDPLPHLHLGAGATKTDRCDKRAADQTPGVSFRGQPRSD